jgi:hypothetical protein
MRSVSCLDWAFAGNHTAGAAGRTAPAATALIDFNTSRRFIITSNPARQCCGTIGKGHANDRRSDPLRQAADFSQVCSARVSSNYADGPHLLHSTAFLRKP